MNRKEKYLLYSSNLWNLGEGLFGPFLAIFSQQLGGNISETSYAYSIYLLVTGFLTIIVGKISDKKFSKEFLCFLGYFINLIATICEIFIYDISTLYLVQVLFGIGLALSNPTWKALFEENNTKGREGTNWGIASGEVSFMLGIATIIGGFILAHSNFKSLFIIMSLIQCVATFYQFKVWKKGKDKIW